jgi:N,N'-diacetyllegionaminate synthase
MIINIDRKIISSESPTFIIAEVAQAHDGSLGMAHAYIDAAYDAGVDAIKFQTHIAASESTLDENFRVKFSRQDKTRFEYWKRMEFSFDEWLGLANHAKEKGLIFLSSPFSIDAFELLNKLDVPMWKVGSGEFENNQLIDAMINSKKPILYSTGMSNWIEIDQSVDYFRKMNAQFVLMQCTTMYPTNFDKIGLNVFEDFKNKYDCLIGFSDHSGEIYAPLYSIANGINVFEAHITFDKRMFGPDISSSLTIDNFKLLTNFNKQIHKIKSNPVNKDLISDELKFTKELFSKSLATIRDVEIGEIITKELITLKKPGTGILFNQINQILGRKAIRKISSNKLITWEDIQD